MSWPGQAIGLRYLSLKFDNRDTEVAFLASFGKTMTRRLFGVSLCGTAFLVLVTLVRVFQWKASIGDEWRFALLAASYACIFAMAAIAWAVMRGTLISREAAEVCTVFNLVILMIIIVLQDRHYLSQWVSMLTGLPASEVRSGLSQADDSDSSVLLCLMSMLNIVHVGVPVRWCVVVAAEVAAPLVYGLAVVIFGSSMPHDALWNLLGLATIVYATALGKRTMEVHERLLFMSMLREKQLRFQSEFELEQFAERGKSEPLQRPEDASSEAATEGIFGDLRRTDVGGGFETQLTKIMKIGHREHWLIPAQHLRLPLRPFELGAGGFGSVLAGSLHGTPVAVKIARGRKITQSTNLKEIVALGNELRILRYVRHPGIVLFHGAVIDLSRGSFCLVLEMVAGVQLDLFIRGQGRLSHELPDACARLAILIGVCRALRYLHSLSPQIVHGDVKPQNIMVEGTAPGAGVRAKLLDFGLSRILTSEAQPTGGTLIWMAPELIRDPRRKPDDSVDVFSFGRLMYFTATGIVPLENVPNSVILNRAKALAASDLDWPKNGPVLDIDRGLTQSCVSPEPSNRPGLAEVSEALSEMRSSTESTIDNLKIDCVGAVRDLRSASLFVETIPPGMPVVPCASSLDSFNLSSFEQLCHNQLAAAVDKTAGEYPVTCL